MTRKAPGKHYRKGLSILQVTRMFPDNKTAERWYQDVRWPDGPFCPYCGSFSVQSNIKHKTMTHRCRDCPEKPMFSLKTGTVMQGSKLDYQVWAIATYLLTTNIKGISSMKLHRDLEVTQKTAWHLAHRLRKGLIQERAAFSGPTEVDETYIGGKEINKHNARKLKAGRGTVGKAIVVGAKDCATNNISAATVKNNDKETLQGFVSKRVRQDAIVYTDDHRGYTGLPYKHGTVKHSTREYVNGMVHTNGIESFWALLKRGYHGIYHHMSAKHLPRYVSEFTGRHNVRELDTIDQMESMVLGMNGKRLTYSELIS